MTLETTSMYLGEKKINKKKLELEQEVIFQEKNSTGKW